jgi:hypothetical protein
MHCRPLLHYFVQGCQIFQNGLPDGKFSNQKAQFGLSMEDVGKFIGHWCILWPFGVFCGHLVYFVVIWYIFGHLVYFWPFGIVLAIWYIFGHLVYIPIL